MKALLTDGKGELWLEDIERPVTGPYDCLVRIDTCLFCNTTDRHIVEGSFDFDISYPAVLGHESVGTVVACGEKVRHFRPGDRVIRPYAIYPDETTGRGSGWGGFAEYGKIRDFKAEIESGKMSERDVPPFFRYMQKIPADLPAEKTRMISCLREVCSATDKIPDVEGRSFLISGAGVVGLLFVYFLKLRGAARVVVAARRPEVRQFVETQTAADEAISFDDPVPRAFDAMIESTGSVSATKELLKKGALSPHARLYLYGVYSRESEMNSLLTGLGEGQSLRIDPREESAHETVCALLRNGALDQTVGWVSDTFPMKNFASAWEKLKSKTAIKIALDCH